MHAQLSEAERQELIKETSSSSGSPAKLNDQQTSAMLRKRSKVLFEEVTSYNLNIKLHYLQERFNQAYLLLTAPMTDKAYCEPMALCTPVAHSLLAHMRSAGFGEYNLAGLIKGINLAQTSVSSSSEIERPTDVAQAAEASVQVNDRKLCSRLLLNALRTGILMY